MKRVKRSALVPYSNEQMFDIINDVRAYPQFLPWCAGSRVLSETEDELVATLEIARSGMSQRFTTRNQLFRPESMTLELVDGPFTALSGEWHLLALGNDGCKVSMQLRFEFSSRIMNMTFGSVFNVAADQMVDAFCRRAEKVYGVAGRLS
ncbi:MAG: type II toxin-antitoxin system RatA family toxin [Pseudomonadales bacterium]|nr:type II toxin-antitoxin system RatA family toxin [Pseudomonadales bacterium]